MDDLVTCNTPGCSNRVSLVFKKGMVREYAFCSECRKEHSYRVLVTQVKHKKSIREVILDARMFKSASHMADYVGVSFPTMYHWMRKYFNMTFQEFRRQYICKSDDCYLLNIYMLSYSRNDYILQKLRKRKYCACINALEKDYIMTNAPIHVVSRILSGRPKIDKISDNTFAVMPQPIYIPHGPCPVYNLYSAQPIYI